MDHRKITRLIYSVSCPKQRNKCRRALEELRCACHIKWNLRVSFVIRDDYRFLRYHIMEMFFGYGEFPPWGSIVASMQKFNMYANPRTVEMIFEKIMDCGFISTYDITVKK